MTRIRSQVLAGFAALALLALVVWQVGALAERRYLGAASARAETALGLTRNALDAWLARYEVTPQLLAELEAVRQLVADPDNPVRRAAINRMLEERNAMMQSSDLYIMRLGGETIAASNHGRPDTFVGQNFSYRPYYYDAAEGAPTRFYALGTTSGVRGYYFSAPIRDPAGRIAGVIAVKIGVDAVEESWRGSEYRIFVSDPEGIVFMSSDAELRYGTILPQTPERRARTEASRRYSDARLREILFQPRAAEGVTLVRLPGIAEPGREGAAREYVMTATEMPEAGWTVHVLLDSAEARAEAQIARIAAALLFCVAAFAGLILAQRRARVAERLALQARAREELEHRVIERTADLARVNSHLEQEITERRATEAALRAAQARLVQVGKLAALGQMSATLSHEINQPLAAARNYADSAAILIERGDLPRAKENIALILSLIDRMSAIGRHLRNAARKPQERLEDISLAPLIEEMRIILAARLASSGAELILDIPEDLPSLRAGSTRLQQVLVNLVTNAADAAEGAEDRRIMLSARAEGGHVLIRVRDHGPGVPEVIAERIFDPFFTTKGVGAGLGLGLSISFNIMRDFGGDISLRDAAPGAEFTLTLQSGGRVGHAAEAAE